MVAQIRRRSAVLTINDRGEWRYNGDKVRVSSDWTTQERRALEIAIREAQDSITREHFSRVYDALGQLLLCLSGSSEKSLQLSRAAYAQFLAD